MIMEWALPNSKQLSLKKASTKFLFRTKMNALCEVGWFHGVLKPRLL